MRGRTTSTCTSVRTVALRSVNPPGTRGWTGGIDGTELVYTESDADRSGDLVLYDMASDSTIPLPTGVNTGRIEHNATNSGDYLLFDRDRFTRRRAVERIVLFNTATRRRSSSPRGAATAPSSRPAR